jgi:hypothetical protein
MTWWDHDTGSIWSQPLGEAIMGPLKGTRLDLYPSTLTTWGAWRQAHPESLALNVHAWATGFHLEDMAVIVDLGSAAAAYPIPLLRAEGVINDVVGGHEVAIVIDPEDENRWAVFSRRLDRDVVSLFFGPDGLTDVGSGSVFHPFSGVGRSGEFSEQDLARLPGFTSFPDDFETFFPGMPIWDG